MPNQSELLESIDNRLKMLLKLEIEDRLDEYDTIKEKVRVLHELDFSTQETAEMIGTSAGSVRAARSNLRDEGKIDG